MIVEELSKRIKRAMKEGDTVTRDVLRVALGEIQTAEARAGAALAEGEAAGVVRKLIKSNEETMAVTEDPGARATLERENGVLREFLPTTLGVAQIVDALAGVADAVRGAPNDGAATGVAMKALKAAGAQVTGKDVSEAVRALRAGLAPRSAGRGGSTVRIGRRGGGTMRAAGRALAAERCEPRGGPWRGGDGRVALQAGGRALARGRWPRGAASRGAGPGAGAMAA